MSKLLNQALVVVAALGAGWALRAATSSPTEKPGTIAVAAPAAPPPVVTRCNGVTADEVRAILAEQKQPSIAPEDVPSAPAAPSAESQQAISKVQAAADDGRWTLDDHHLLEQRLVGLSREEREALLSSLAVAVNEGRLQIVDGIL